MVEPHEPGDEQKTPFRMRRSARRGERTGSSERVRGRPRRLGRTQGRGAIRELSTSAMLQGWSVRPAAIAGVEGAPSYVALLHS